MAEYDYERVERLEAALNGLLEECDRHFDGAPHINCTWGPFLTAMDEARTELETKTKEER